MTQPPNAPPAPRGAGFNPKNRFEQLEVVLDPVELEKGEEPAPLRTVFLRDDSQTIIAWDGGPVGGFAAGISPYRGCEHGCASCVARPTHEYLGMSAGRDFESKSVVKPNAHELLRGELSKKSWTPQVIAMSGVTDCYQPIE